jgi:hypothetical protein
MNVATISIRSKFICENFCKGSKRRGKEQASPTVSANWRRRWGERGAKGEWEKRRMGEEEKGRRGEGEKTARPQDRKTAGPQDCRTAGLQDKKKGHCMSDPFSIEKQAYITA